MNLHKSQLQILFEAANIGCLPEVSSKNVKYAMGMLQMNDRRMMDDMYLMHSCLYFDGLIAILYNVVYGCNVDARTRQIVMISVHCQMIKNRSNGKYNFCFMNVV